MLTSATQHKSPTCLQQPCHMRHMSAVSAVSVASASEDVIASVTVVGRVLSLLAWPATVIGAATAANAAKKSGMDLVGACIVGHVATSGGGTIRNALLAKPSSWWGDSKGLVVSFASSFAGYYFLDKVKKMMKIKESTYENSLEWISSIVGLGPAACAGAMLTIAMKGNAFHNVLLTLLSANGGGILRDILLRRPISAFDINSPMYAPCAILGSFAYMGAKRMNLSVPLRISTGFTTAIAMRRIALKHNISLGRCNKEGKEKKKTEIK